MSKIKYFVFLTAFLITTILTLMFFKGEDIHTDAFHYVASAKSIVFQGRYLENGEPAKYPIGVSFFISIPLFLNLPIVSIYVLFSCLTLIVIYKLARLFMEENYALLTILFFSSHPSFILFSGTYTSEIFSIFFITYIVYLWGNEDNLRIKNNIMWLGMITGIATLIHYVNGIFFLIILCLLLRKKEIKNCFIFSIFFILLLAPQIIYNINYHKNLTGGYYLSTKFPESEDAINPIYIFYSPYNKPNLFNVLYHLVAFDWVLVFFTVYGLMYNFGKKKFLYYFLIGFALVWLVYCDTKRRNLFPLFGLMMIPTMLGFKEFIKNMGNKWLIFILFLVSIFWIHINIALRCIGF